MCRHGCVRVCVLCVHMKMTAPRSMLVGFGFLRSIVFFFSSSSFVSAECSKCSRRFSATRIMMMRISDTLHYSRHDDRSHAWNHLKFIDDICFSHLQFIQLNLHILRWHAVSSPDLFSRLLPPPPITSSLSSRERTFECSSCLFFISKNNLFISEAIQKKKTKIKSSLFGFIIVLSWFCFVQPFLNWQHVIAALLLFLLFPVCCLAESRSTSLRSTLASCFLGCRCLCCCCWTQNEFRKHRNTKKKKRNEKKLYSVVEKHKYPIHFQRRCAQRESPARYSYATWITRQLQETAKYNIFIYIYSCSFLLGWLVFGHGRSYM